MAASAPAAAAAAATACSKCEREFSVDGVKAAGSCSTCPDGHSLCQRCVARHATSSLFGGHDCRPLGEVYAGAEFLERMGLAPAPKVCLRHAQPYLGLRCSACAHASAAGSTPRNLCAACVKKHTLAHPTHVLAPIAPDVPGLRAKLLALAAVPAVVLGGFMTADAVPGASETPPCLPAAAETVHLLKGARRRALAALAELDALTAHKEAALAQIDENRDAVIAAAQECHRANTEAVEAAAADKQTRLEAEVVAADAALDAAVSATTALAEAVSVLDDADIVQHGATLTARYTAAQAALAVIPEQPVTSSFLAIGPVPGPESLRAKIEKLMGALSVARVKPPPPPPIPADLSPEHAAQLQAWLPPSGSPNPLAWQEVYRATTHGFGASAFHGRCDGRARLLVLVWAQEGGWLFGGFTAVGFSPPQRWIADPAAFLFSLTNSLGRPEKLESTGTDGDLYYDLSRSATFRVGLSICDDANTRAVSFTQTGMAYAASASTGAHPMAQGKQGGWLAAEVVAWVV